MKLLDYPFGRDTDGTDEQGNFRLDEDIDQFRELALGVVVLWAATAQAEGWMVI